MIFTRAPAVELASSDVRAGRLPDGRCRPWRPKLPASITYMEGEPMGIPRQSA